MSEAHGEIDFSSISFRKVMIKKVYKNNKTSGKVLVPSDLIGKEVLVIVPGKKRRKNRDISWADKL